jgi:hypothetical protein
MKIRLIAVVIVCSFAAVAEARSPFFRSRSSVSRSQLSRSDTPPQSSSLRSSPSATSIPSASTMQSDEQMTKIYGPSILDRS